MVYTPTSVIPAIAANKDNVIHSAKGGVFRAKPGGYMVNLAEAGQDEAVIPLDGKHGVPGSTGICVPR